MAEETATEGTETDAGGTTTETTETAEEAALPDGVKKALAAARKDAREAEKARKALETEVQGFKQRDMTEQQKLEARATTAEKAAESATRELTRLRVAAAAGLDMADADLITGATEEEMTAVAKRLVERFGGQQTNFDGGARGNAAAAGDMNQMIRGALRR